MDSQTKSKSPNDLLSQEQVEAEYPGVFRKKTLATWRCRGKGPKVTKIGWRCFYRRSHIDEFLEKCVIDPSRVDA